MDKAVVVHVFDGAEGLDHGLRRILLSKAPQLNDTIEQLTARDPNEKRIENSFIKGWIGRYDNKISNLGRDSKRMESAQLEDDVEAIMVIKNLFKGDNVLMAESGHDREFAAHVIDARAVFVNLSKSKVRDRDKLSRRIFLGKKRESEARSLFCREMELECAPIFRWMNKDI